jgi:hypothetical protein
MLQQVLAKSKSYQNLIEDHSAFNAEIENNFVALTSERFEILNGIIKKYGSIDHLLEKASSDERAFLLNLSKNSAPKLSISYVNLISELEAKYYFLRSDLHDIIVNELTSENHFEAESAVGRSQISCAGECSNAAERYYWQVFSRTRDSDLSAYGATTFYAGCLTGCYQK